MKTLYKIKIIALAALSFNLAYAGGTNTNSPTNTPEHATIEASFDKNNKTVTVKTFARNNKSNIEQVVLNFEDGSQEKFKDINKKSIQVKPTSKFGYLRIIGVYVASDNNNPLMPDDSSGYGHYIMNPDAFAANNPYHDFQTDLGDVSANRNSNAQGPKCTGKVLICHVPPGNWENRHTIYVSCNAWKAHQQHCSHAHPGDPAYCDQLGECPGDDPGTVIPVELVSFNAKKLSPEMVRLSWTTASEVNNDYIQIEKTTDLNNWEHVCKVHGKGDSREMNHYSCTDSSANAGGQSTVYYRPKQVDFNGTYEYFNIIKLRLESSNTANAVESVYPNPATDRIKIQYNAAENGIVNIRLLTIEGKAILVSTYNAKQGQQVVDVDLPENDLAKGLYVLEVESEGNVHRQKVYKQ